MKKKHWFVASYMMAWVLFAVTPQFVDDVTLIMAHGIFLGVALVYLFCWGKSWGRFFDEDNLV